MPDIVFEKDRFLRRVKKIYQCWEAKKYEKLKVLGALAFCVGKSDDSSYSKSTSLQTWLFGYELTDTLVAMCKTDIYILASRTKVDFLKALAAMKENDEGCPSIHLLTREKTDKDKANFEKITKALEASIGKGQVLGEFSKDKTASEFVSAFKEAVKKCAFETSDMSSDFALVMATKDEHELEITKKATELSCTIFTKFLREQIIDSVDGDKKTKHSRLSEGVENALGDSKYIGKLPKEDIESCYPAIIQSANSSQYALKFSATSDKNLLYTKPGTILCCLGIRYKNYCSNLVRTIMVEPPDELQEIYSLLLEAEEKAFEALVPGNEMKRVYEAAYEHVNAKRPHLADKMTKNVGFGMGIEFKENALFLGPKNTALIEPGMLFNVSVGFSDIDHPSSTDNKKVAFFLGDTVVVSEEGPPKVLTDASKRKVKSVSLFFKKDDEQSGDEEHQDSENLLELARTSKRSTVVLQNQLRDKLSGEDKRKLKQKELAEQLNKEARQRIADARKSGTENRVRKSNISYKNYGMVPQDNEIKQLKIFVDKKYETVIMPIFCVPTPFHISMIKNISQSIEGDFTYLRINFFHPGATIVNQPSAQFPKPDATYLKELTYRSSNLKEPGELSAPSSNLNTAFRLIKEVQKKFRAREAEESEKEGVVKQDKMVLSVNKGNPRLKDLYIRPNIVTKRISGSLEAHVNGFRYTSIRGDKVDILYNNIKHAFFQPCDHEMIILIHFNLKNAILFGKKKHSDLQFFTEVGEITTDLAKHSNMHDRDDMIVEQREREMRHRLNMAFKAFCEKVEKLTNQEVEFDTPFRDLGFHGVPFRSSVLLQPTSAALVNLTEWAPFVITLEDVELVHFERVNMSLKNFDMVFVFKDYNKKPSMVSAIPMNMLEHVKEWLNSCDIRYTEGLQSLNWPKIMKTIVDDPDGFFETGGWNFLNPESDEDKEEMSDEEEEDYNPSEDSEEDVSDADSAENYESEASTDDSDASGEASLASSDESGKSWSDLEAEAAKDDRTVERETHDDVTSRSTSKSKKISAPPRRRK